MSYKDAPFAERFATMGDTAEAIFERVWPTNWERWGLNRPNLAMHMLPARIRHSPDYLTSRNFIEVKGCGKDQTFKLKVVEHNCMHFWNNLHPVLIFFYDMTHHRWTFTTLGNIDQMIENSQVQLGSFPEGKAYFGIHALDVGGWTDVEP